MKFLATLLLLAVIVFSMISFFSGTSFSNFINGVSSEGTEEPEKNKASSEPSQWKVIIEKANAELALLAKYVDEYDTGEDQEATLKKITETLKNLKAMESTLENEEDKLDGDELKEMRIEYRQFKKDLKQIIRENSVLKDAMDKIENPGQSSDGEGADDFFGD